ncbi:MAG TPA: YceI family protein [Dokdonella sp.]|uniref:YceI family protein n=1 Tax=Dokdonella sp. TaxID=2291710 RepID=UPI002BBC7155|nr:YceI family protein [Dokdonella sp.]HUD40618.1 YceI family protein [Dokdonella sp.]
MSRLLWTLVLLIVPFGAQARDWQVDAAKSTLGFSAVYDGESFDGRFAKFTAAIRYDAADPASGRFDVSVDTASVTTHNDERDESLTGSDFFDVARFPKARFQTTAFTVGPDGAVSADGTLTIRDRSRPVRLRVVFAESGASATLDVETTLQRTDFDLGASSDWSDVGKDVVVKGHLVLNAG